MKMIFFPRKISRYKGEKNLGTVTRVERGKIQK